MPTTTRHIFYVRDVCIVVLVVCILNSSHIVLS